MKKILSLLLSILMIACLFSGCAKKPQYVVDDYDDYSSNQQGTNSDESNSNESNNANTNSGNSNSQPTNNPSKDNSNTSNSIDASLIGPGGQTSSSPSKVDYAGGKVTLSGKPANESENILNYKAGQEINFVLNARTDKNIYKDLQISYKATYEDGTPVQTGIGNCDDKGNVQIKLKGKGPGFIFITATACVGGVEVSKVSTFAGGVGVDVDKITATKPAPADFENYWKGKISSLPTPKTISKVKLSSATGYDVYKVKIAGPNDNAAFKNDNSEDHNYLSIILCVPTKGGSFPVNVKYIAHGVSNITDHSSSANEIKIIVQSHSIEANLSDTYYFNNYKKILGSYQNNSFDGQSYFVNMLLRDYQVIRWIQQNNLSQFQVNSNGNISLTGGSQGGFRSTAVAGLCGMTNVPIKSASISIVWNCNLSGHDTMNIDSWHTTYNQYTKYIDAVYFAPYANCKFTISEVGLGDKIAPPSSNMALFNALKTATITFKQNYAHGSGGARQYTYDLSKK